MLLVTYFVQNRLQFFFCSSNTKLPQLPPPSLEYTINYLFSLPLHSPSPSSLPSLSLSLSLSCRYPLVGDSVVLLAHPFGTSKMKMDLTVTAVNRTTGHLTFDRTTHLVNPNLHPDAPENRVETNHIPDGCHGAPITYEGRCVAVLQQPRINEVRRERDGRETEKERVGGERAFRERARIDAAGLPACPRTSPALRPQHRSTL